MFQDSMARRPEGCKDSARHVQRSCTMAVRCYLHGSSVNVRKEFGLYRKGMRGPHRLM